MKVQETEINFSYDAYVLMSLGRIHTVSCDPNRSLSGYGQESGIDQLWHTIPTNKKKKYAKKWEEVKKALEEINKLPTEKERDREYEILIGVKQQIVTDTFHSLNLLFAARNPVVANWEKISKREEKKQ